MIVWTAQRNGVHTLAFTPDGAGLLVAGRSPDLFLADPLTGARRWTGPTPPRRPPVSAAVSPTGRHAAAAGWHWCRVYGLATGAVVHDLVGDTAGLAFSPGGATLAFPGGPGCDQVFTLDVASGAVSHRFNAAGHGSLNRLAWSPDGRRLAVLGTRRLTLVDAATGRDEWAVRVVGAAAGVGGLAFSPDGRTLAVGVGPRLLTFPVPPGAGGAQRQPARTHIQDLAFTPDGRFLLTVGNEATVRVWEADGWTMAREFAWDVGPLKAVAVAPDGQRAAAGSGTGRVVVWDWEV